MDGLNDYKEVNGPQTYPDETEHCEISLIDYRDNREIQLDLSNCRQEIVQSLQDGLYDKAYDIFMQLDPEIQNTFYCELKENTDIDKSAEYLIFCIQLHDFYLERDLIPLFLTDNCILFTNNQFLMAFYRVIYNNFKIFKSLTLFDEFSHLIDHLFSIFLLTKHYLLGKIIIYFFQVCFRDLLQLDVLKDWLLNFRDLYYENCNISDNTYMEYFVMKCIIYSILTKRGIYDMNSEISYWKEKYNEYDDLTFESKQNIALIYFHFKYIGIFDQIKEAKEKLYDDFEEILNTEQFMEYWDRLTLFQTVLCEDSSQVNIEIEKFEIYYLFQIIKPKQ